MVGVFGVFKKLGYGVERLTVGRSRGGQIKKRVSKAVVGDGFGGDQFEPQSGHWLLHKVGV